VSERLGDTAGEPRFTFFVDGDPVQALAGETIATALLAAGRRTLRHTGTRGEPRGLYCVMGVCWECAVVIDGRTVRSCMTPAAPGLAVDTRRGPS
jgi:aerobic-type carbon monoxide dehydrogenase small subunit (CoxS/CutS family)